MTVLNLVLWVAGIVLVAIGWQRARGPWNRLQELREQDANEARYAAWRGGIRTPNGPTGASVAMDMLRTRMRIGVGIAAAGIVLIVAGFAVR
ncbi:MAG TPA: hypothetical protein VFR93_11080 [Candidatus Limnocylindrales bacterium]|nr:hypothetical protein [Candidatus Limnocylindrales bacterium]